MPELLQHAFVTAAAILASWIIGKRVFSAVAPDSPGPQCSSCPKAPQHAGAPAAAGSSSPARAASTSQPLILIKSTDKH